MKTVIYLVLAVLILSACSAQPTETPTPVGPTPLPPVKSTGLTSTEGQIEPRQSINLSFAAGGEVAEVLVKEGAQVRAGEAIARLKADALEVAVARAEAGVAAARANEARYLEGLPQQIAAAQAEVQAAQAQLAAASARRNNAAEVATAESALAQARLNLKAAEDAYKDILDKKQLGPTEEAARLNVENAQRAVDAAQIRLDQIRRGSLNDQANAAGIEAAQARLAAAEAQLAKLQAEANGQPDPAYAAAIQQAEAALASARIRLADAVLTAPFAGTLARLDIEPGETVGPGSPIGVLADFSGWQVETTDLTELKVPAVRIGQPAIVVADALPGVELKGEVVAIGAVFQEKSGDVVYPVKIRLLDADARLRWGMTVSVSFEQ